MLTLPANFFIPAHPELEVKYPNGSAVYLETEHGKPKATGFVKGVVFPDFQKTFKTAQARTDYIKSWQKQLEDKNG